MEPADLKTVADIWLSSNLEAHDFIPKEYWQGCFESVRDALGEAEVYVYEDEGGVRGFIGLNGEYVEGIFVARDSRSRGIGKLLLDHAKGLRGFLELRVYAENWPAAKFYYREGFTLCSAGVDEATGADEYQMGWWK